MSASGPVEWVAAESHPAGRAGGHSHRLPRSRGDDALRQAAGAGCFGPGPLERSPSEASAFFYRSLWARPEATRMVRHALAEHFEATAVEDGARHTALLCLQEALANAVRHSLEPRSRIGVSVQVDTRAVTMEVRDQGGGFDPSALELTTAPDPLSEHGRGLFLMEQLTDDLQIASDGRGTTVRMTLHLSAIHGGPPSPVSLAGASH